MKVGDKVKFKEILDDGDDEAVMEILEDRGDRVLVKDLRLADWAIVPTSVYRKHELEVIDEA